MATKTLYNSPTVNPFSFLQEEGQVDAQADKRGPKKDDASTVLTPAQKAERRAAANAEKAKEQEAAKQKAEADRALAALVGPLDDFVTQKGPKKSQRDPNEKKLKSREEFEATGKDKTHRYEGGERQNRRNDGYEKKPFDGQRKDRAPGEKKPYNNREGGSGQHDPKRVGDQAYKKRETKEGNTGQQAPRRGREFDKHSAGKTSNKPEDKRRGEGQANWGNPLDTTVATEGGWGDATETQPAADAGETGGWGDDNEPASTPVHEEEPKFGGEDKDTKPEKREPTGPSWDDEGYGKMTLKEFQEKVAAEKAAQLANAVGVVQPRARDLKDVDLSKFVEKEAFDDEKYGKKSDKKEKKKPAASARAGEKQVCLTDVFAVGRGAGGPRGGRGGDRPQGERRQGDRPQGERRQGDRPQGERQQRDNDNKPRGGQGRGNTGDFSQTHKVPSKKQFPELSAAVNK